MKIRYFIVAALALAACKKKEVVTAPVYQAVPVETRDIVVSAQASGSILPDTTVEVKSKASGEILEILVESGQIVRRGELMVRVDPRTAKNQMAQAEADLEVANATLANAQAQKRRSDELFRSQSITETEYESAQLTEANAKASVVRAQVALENAKIRLEDTDVRAPITGTVIVKNVERGQVISSPSTDVGGGTALLQMADLNLVQVRTLVDETDIGKIRAGLQATVSVDAYPNRPFEGQVLKIEPQATTQQNVTMFPVIVRIQNREGLLRPGMNAEVEIHVGRRDQVLAIPNAALRTSRDVSSAAEVLGLDPKAVEATLAASMDTTHKDSLGARTASSTPDTTKKPAGEAMTLPDGRQIPLPAGITTKQVTDILAKRRQGQQLTAEESAIMRRAFSGVSGGGGGADGRRQSQSNDNLFGGRYIVFVLRNGQAIPTYVRTGLTDLDYSEVISGLEKTDSVLVLPSASLVQSQLEFNERMQRMTGGGTMGGLRQTPTTTTGGTRQ